MFYIQQIISRYKPAPEDQLSKAFDVLDQEKKGYLTTEELTKYMTEEGKYWVPVLFWASFSDCMAMQPSINSNIAVSSLCKKTKSRARDCKKTKKYIAESLGVKKLTRLCYSLYIIFARVLSTGLKDYLVGR